MQPMPGARPSGPSTTCTTASGARSPARGPPSSTRSSVSGLRRYWIDNSLIVSRAASRSGPSAAKNRHHAARAAA